MRRTTTHWGEPIGDDRLNRALRNEALDAKNAKQLARIARETESTMPERQTAGATAAGDERRLRGVPVQARGVGGVITGTRPGENLG